MEIEILAEINKLSVPKGACDFTPQQMVVRNKAFKLITEIF